jgi:acyl carrier protein
MNQSEIHKDIREHLINEFGLDPSIGDDTSLFSSKMLDSMDVLRLIVFIEQRFDIKIPVFEVSLEMFDDIDSISNLIEKLK